MEYDELELDTLGEEKTALFVIISDTDATFNFVVSIMYSQLFNLLCDKADDVYNGRLPVHVRMLLDEFANIGQIPQFEKLMEGFFLGESIPVNEKLSEIFLQLHISEKSGRGVPKITEMYGKDAFSFRENSIVVTIPFERINKVGNKVGKKVGDKKPLNSRRQKIISEMRDNPNITTAELHNILGVSETAVENNISFLRENGYIERVGSKKAGYWKVL